jgi:hypothetical protein
MTIRSICNLFIFASLLALFTSPPGRCHIGDNRINLGEFGISVSPPNGWKRTFERRENYVIGWTRSAEVGAPPVAGVIIEMEPSDGGDLNHFAELGAKNVGGIISEVSPSLNGTASKLIKVNANNANVGPLLVIVSFRDGMVYKLGAFGKRLEDVEAAFNEVRNGWHWEPFKSPTESIQLSDRVYEVSGMGVTLKLPEAMREFSSQPTGITKLFLYDPRTQSLPFVVDISQLPKLAVLSILQVRDRFGAGVVSRMKLTSKLEWKNLPGTIPKYLTNTFEPPEAQRERGYKGVAKYALIKLADDRIGLMSFSFTGKDAEDRKKYEKLAEAILKSLEITKPSR